MTRHGAADAGGRPTVGPSTGSAGLAAAVLRYYQVRFGSPDTRDRYRRIARVALVVVLTVVVAVTVAGVVAEDPWWGAIAVLAIGLALAAAGALLALVALKNMRVIGVGSAIGPSPTLRAPVNRRQARPGVLTAGERSKVEMLERLYLHRKEVVDRSPKPDLGPEAEAWSDMIEAKLKLGLCGWPGCRNRDWAYSFCAEHDSRRTGRKATVSQES